MNEKKERKKIRNKQGIILMMFQIIFFSLSCGADNFLRYIFIGLTLYGYVMSVDLLKKSIEDR